MNNETKAKGQLIELRGKGWSYEKISRHTARMLASSRPFASLLMSFASFHRLCAMLPFSERIVSVPHSRYLPVKNRGILVPKNPTTIGGHLRRKRLGLGIHQSEAARILKVSTVTLSRWECDKVYPTWEQQPGITSYLGYDPFVDPALGRPKGNETINVASLSSKALFTMGEQILKYRLKQKKTRKQFAEELGITPKTLWGWETNRRRPSVEQYRTSSDAGLWFEALIRG